MENFLLKDLYTRCQKLGDSQVYWQDLRYNAEISLIHSSLEVESEGLVFS